MAFPELNERSRGVGPAVRRLRIVGDPSIDEVAAESGCAVTAVVRAWPFIADDESVVIVAAAYRPMSNADVLSALGVSRVRMLQAAEIALGLESLMRPGRVYIDEATLDHPEVVYCTSAPNDFAASSPQLLAHTLGAVPVRVSR